MLSTPGHKKLLTESFNINNVYNIVKLWANIFLLVDLYKSRGIFTIVFSKQGILIFDIKEKVWRLHSLFGEDRTRFHIQINVGACKF